MCYGTIDTIIVVVRIIILPKCAKLTYVKQSPELALFCIYHTLSTLKELADSFKNWGSC